MTLFYRTQSWSSQPQVTDQTKKLWKRYAKKKNWRITQLPNGYYQAEWIDFNDNWNGITRRETIEAQKKQLNLQLNITIKN